MKYHTFFSRIFMRQLSIILVIALVFTVAPTKTYAASDTYFPACSAEQTSLVDALAEVGCSDTSFAARAKIAALNGIPEADYAGTADQNKTLLTLLKDGLLVKSNGISTDTGTTSEPAQPMGSTQSYEVMETVERAYLRTSPSKGATTVTVLPANTLVYVLGKKANGAGNQWYQIQYFDQTVYCFAERLAPHEHDYVIAPVGGGDARICECGQVSTSTPQQTFALTASAISMLYVGIAVLATVVYAKHRDAIYDAADALIYGAEEVADAIGSYGLRVLSNGLTMAVKLNKAGGVVSVRASEFANYMDENTDDSGERKYFSAMVIRNANGSDSVMVINPLDDAMNLKEACDYLDATLAAEGAFGCFWDFQDATPSCNIYTYTQPDAEALCDQVVQCPRNIIDTYGLSNIGRDASGLFKVEHNADCRIIGTYDHFHLHKLTDSYRAVKSCPHVFFGEMYIGPGIKAA